MVAGIERAQDGVLGGETAREREAVPRVLERRDARLERVSGRVAAAGVFVAAVLPDRFLRERRRQADRHARPRRSPRRAPAPRGSRASRTRRHRWLIGSCGARSARNDSTSERVSTPIGWPPSSTSTDGPCSRHATTRGTGSPTPIIGIGGVMTSAIGRSSTPSSRNVRSISSSSRSVPTTSLAASGNSLVTLTTTWETPVSCITRDRVAHLLLGEHEHEVGKTGTLRGRDVAGDETLAAQEAHVEHPLVVEDLREVAATGVGQQHHHDRVGAERARDLEGRAHGRAARPADEETLFVRDPARHQERIGVADFHDAVDDAAVEGGRPEVLADPFDEIRPAGATRVHRARRGRRR